MNTPLANAIQQQLKLGRHRFHFPFHAGVNLAHSFSGDGVCLFSQDLTELPPLDVLGNPEGVLLESQQAIASLFGTQHSYYLINGASVGLMAALLASRINEGSHVLLARNCHRSVAHGMVLTGGTVHWLLPEPLSEWGLWGSISPTALDEKLSQNIEIELFVMTHPTYEGVTSDVAAIAEVCRAHGVKLIVDEAHGTLWSLFDGFPASAIAAGADAVVHSLHKSAGSLTQTALLHLPKGYGLIPEDVQQSLNLLQTTSPSYPLLVNMEATCAFLDSPDGRCKVADLQQQSQELRQWIADSLSTLRVLPHGDGLSRFQLFLKSNRLDGEALAEALEETHNIAYEAATPYGVLLSLNIGLPQAAFDALRSALSRIDAQSRALPKRTFPPITFSLPEVPENGISLRSAFTSFASTVVSQEDAVGRRSSQIIASCPPGIPILFPGEVITPHHLPYLPELVQVAPLPYKDTHQQ